MGDWEGRHTLHTISLRRIQTTQSRLQNEKWYREWHKITREWNSGSRLELLQMKRSSSHSRLSVRWFAVKNNNNKNKNMEERMVGVMTLGKLIYFAPLLAVGHHQCHFQWKHISHCRTASHSLLWINIMVYMFQIKREINHRKRKQVPWAEQNSVCFKLDKESKTNSCTHITFKRWWWCHHAIKLYNDNTPILNYQLTTAVIQVEQMKATWLIRVGCP